MLLFQATFRKQTHAAATRKKKERGTDNPNPPLLKKEKQNDNTSLHNLLHFAWLRIKQYKQLKNYDSIPQHKALR